jgi:hypothetical protein
LRHRHKPHFGEKYMKNWFWQIRNCITKCKMYICCYKSYIWGRWYIWLVCVAGLFYTNHYSDPRHAAVPHPPHTLSSPTNAHYTPLQHHLLLLQIQPTRCHRTRSVLCLLIQQRSLRVVRLHWPTATLQPAWRAKQYGRLCFKTAHYPNFPNTLYPLYRNIRRCTMTCVNCAHSA